jgi:ribosomal protein S18 acetylase RimI-like enzyme
LVGDHLIQAAKKMAKETQAIRMRVSSSINNDVAHKLYESLGFVEDHEFKNFILPISQD